MMKRKLILILTVIFLVSISSNSFSQSKAKSTGTATALSVILPGAGHMYAGENNTGLAMMSIYAGSMGLVIAYGPWTWEEEKKSKLFPELAEGTGTSTTTKIICMHQQELQPLLGSMLLLMQAQP